MGMTSACQQHPPTCAASKRQLKILGVASYYHPLYAAIENLKALFLKILWEEIILCETFRR